MLTISYCDKRLRTKHCRPGPPFLTPNLTPWRYEVSGRFAVPLPSSTVLTTCSASVLFVDVIGWLLITVVGSLLLSLCTLPGPLLPATQNVGKSVVTTCITMLCVIY